MREYEVDSLIQMPDDVKVVRHGPVFETKRDAEWYEALDEAAHIPAWIEEVEVNDVGLQPRRDHGS